MNPQLPLAMSLRPELTLESYIAGSNAQLLQALRDLATGQSQEQLFVSGPAGSGKSHLLMGTVSAAQSAGHSSAYLPFEELARLSPEMLDDLDQLDLLAFDDLHLVAGNAAWEEALFHLFNRAREKGRRLLFSASHGPSRFELELPDLASRLSWGSSYRIQPLDDAGREALLLEQARKRGLKMKPQAASWMVSHCSRDPRQLLALLNRLDHASLAARRQLTLAFVREQLG